MVSFLVGLPVTAAVIAAIAIAGNALGAVGQAAAFAGFILFWVYANLGTAAFATYLGQQLLTELDAEQFTVRERATRSLAQLGDAIEPLLRKRLASTSSPEAGQRIEVLLDSLRPSLADADTLRDLRVLEILERVGTPDARAALEEVGNGPSGSRLRNRAKAAIQRLDRLSSATPSPAATPRQ